MCEDLHFFLAYPWGRLSFEMMMKSIKDRDVVQLATTCVAVQGIFYALQLVILQAASAIQEGSPAEEPPCSDSEEEPAARVGTRSYVPLKIANAKRLDGNREILVDPIIFPELDMDPNEDLTSDDDCDDVDVDNIKRGVLAKITRARKAQKAPPRQSVKNRDPSPAGISSGGVEVSGIVSPREGQRIEVAENPPLVVEDEEGHIKPVHVVDQSGLGVIQTDSTVKYPLPVAEAERYDKKTKVLVGHPSSIEKDSNIAVNPEERYQNSLKQLKAARTISLGGEESLSNKDVVDIIERQKHHNAKVMDALIRFSRHLLRTDNLDGQKLRVDLLDLKFVSLMIRVGDIGRALLFSEADFLYVPFNFDRKHWVSMCIDLPNGSIVVLDSELQPIALMLPYLLSQASVFQTPTGPFEITRPSCIPQVQSPLDSGIMAYFLIHAHAKGGLEECAEVKVEQLEFEIKRLVSAIILAGVP
ncbi:hypothetical protein CARUB_v10007950mg [Capsella rubella]|uniref:Ubiquitin-like protease family profile domain-containing protein n=1 Tax=Capsella rubella TaxID=81985 RepID=R0EU45_9BRAS|nr:hypothetical protein CARUB_v10007950mg [Capsella rubella]